jgi:hypothetical protein
MSRLALALALCAYACSGAGSDATGAPDDGGAGMGSAPPPELLVSSPSLGAEGVYPASLWAGKGEEVVLALTFSEPMTATGDLALEAHDHVRSVAALEWSHDRTELALFVRPDFTAPRPLEDETEYRLDLSTLVSDSGALLAPDVRLMDRGLTFTTGRYDPLLNHSCGHTFFGPFGSVASSGAADLSAPDISTTHVQYTVSLRETDGHYGGWVRARFPTEGPYRLYFDAATTLLGDDGRELVLERTPPACPGISEQLTLVVEPHENVFLFVGPGDSPMRRVIVELVPEL